MIKKTLAILSSIVLLSACGTAEAKKEERFIEEGFSSYETELIEDSRTGCKYLTFTDYKEGGGITPLLKSNGKPDCPEEGKQ